MPFSFSCCPHSVQFPQRTSLQTPVNTVAIFILLKLPWTLSLIDAKHFSTWAFLKLYFYKRQTNNIKCLAVSSALIKQSKVNQDKLIFLKISAVLSTTGQNLCTWHLEISLKGPTALQLMSRETIYISYLFKVSLNVLFLLLIKHLYNFH